MSETNRIVEAKKFLSTAEEQILIISPYMTPSTLAEALSEVPAGIDVTVICSWRTDDLLFGSSKLETYELCKENGWSLRVDYDGRRRTIHLKAYVIDGETAMIGSANLTQRGMLQNIESLIPVTLDAHSSLTDAIEDSIAGSKPVDDEVYRQFVEHVSSIPKPEKSQTKRLTVVHGDMEREILKRMPPQPGLDDLMSLPSIQKALSVRGLRFSDIRRILRRNSTRGSASNTINDRTMELMQEIVEADSRLDIQKREHSNCLVWKVHHILNEEIHRYLKPYIGKPFKDIGLEEKYWEDSFLGDATKKLRRASLNLLPPEIAEAVGRLTTYPASIYMMPSGNARYPKPIGSPVVLTDKDGNRLKAPVEELLTPNEILDQAWFPSFCLYEPVEGKKLGDSIFRGLVFWECDRKIREKMEDEIAEDINTLREIRGSIEGTHPFRREKDSEVIFTKVASYKDRDKYPLGHPKRTMKRYLTKRLLSSILNDVNIHDH